MTAVAERKTNAFLGGESQDKGGPRPGPNPRDARWLTPKPVVEALGVFDLDPCGAPHHDLARVTYLPERGEDGRELPWFGRIWLNPPYGAEAEPFLRRMVEHGYGTVLMFARTETKLFHTYVWDHAWSILFLKGRLTFLDANLKKATANSGAPSCLIAYGGDDGWALEHSGLAGKHVVL